MSGIEARFEPDFGTLQSRIEQEIQNAKADPPVVLYVAYCQSGWTKLEVVTIPPSHPVYQEAIVGALAVAAQGLHNQHAQECSSDHKLLEIIAKPIDPEGQKNAKRIAERLFGKVEDTIQQINQ